MGEYECGINSSDNKIESNLTEYNRELSDSSLVHTEKTG